MDYDLIVVKTLERVYKNYYYIIRGWCKMDKKDLKDEKLLYNVRETAAVLGVNVHLVYELINRKLLPALLKWSTVYSSV